MRIGSTWMILMTGIQIPAYLASQLVLSVGSGTALKMLLALVSRRQDCSLDASCRLDYLADVCGVAPLTVDHNLDTLARASYTDFNRESPIFTECSMLLSGGPRRTITAIFSQQFVDVCRRRDGYITIDESEFYEYRTRAGLMMRMRFTMMIGNKKRIGVHAIKDEMPWLIGYAAPNLSHACQVGIIPGVQEINTVCHDFNVSVGDRRRGQKANARIGRLDFDVRQLVSHFERRRRSDIDGQNSHRARPGKDETDVAL
jgi:hypothetical protein